MLPDTILLTVQSVADCSAEFLRFIQTDQGKQVVTRWLADGDKARADLVTAGEWLKRLFSGELFGVEPKRGQT